LSTFRGGGIFTGGGLAVTSSTISANSSSFRGGGIYSDGSAPLSIDYSIVAGNTAPIGAPDVRQEMASFSSRYSLIGDGTGTGLTEAPIGSPDVKGNLIGGPANGVIDPMLAPLADNGGPTYTRALLAGSPAIDGVTSNLAPPHEPDQRGLPRMSDGNADGVPRIDMGAYELLLGDVNNDGDINGPDIDPFVEAITSGQNLGTADMNADGIVNGLDVGPFVEAVLGEVGSITAPSVVLASPDPAEVNEPARTQPPNATEIGELSPRSLRPHLTLRSQVVRSSPMNERLLPEDLEEITVEVLD
jgi:predicted outer membrane repeat protein